jgi:uncharacterized membrane protein
MITLTPLYIVVGVLLAFCAYLGFAERGDALRRRLSRGAFWGILSLAFLIGDRIPPAIMGGLVIALALLAALGGANGKTAPAAANLDGRGLGNRLFIPALLIPALTLVGVFLLKPLRVNGAPLLDPNGATLLCLGLGCAAALIVALRLTRQRLPVALWEGRRLLDAMGWAALLPLVLSTLGGVFAAAGVGGAVAELLRTLLPLQHRFVAVGAYAIGMALFTMIMGNAFAAFPVLTAGIGIPVLVQLHHADPAPLGALGMLSGYCGTLLTPMAANFNLVPAALLELSDPHAVIRAQAPTAVLLLIGNIVLMNALLFHK